MGHTKYIKEALYEELKKELNLIEIACKTIEKSWLEADIKNFFVTKTIIRDNLESHAYNAEIVIYSVINNCEVVIANQKFGIFKSDCTVKNVKAVVRHNCRKLMLRFLIYGISAARKNAITKTRSDGNSKMNTHIRTQPLTPIEAYGYEPWDI
tara:strand:+ start:25923 stop:26381 length:459 start_codon:yes stop_codon:yes gene_type:complete